MKEKKEISNLQKFRSFTVALQVFARCIMFALIFYMCVEVESTHLCV